MSQALPPGVGAREALGIGKRTPAFANAQPHTQQPTPIASQPTPAQQPSSTKGGAQKSKQFGQLENQVRKWRAIAEVTLISIWVPVLAWIIGYATGNTMFMMIVFGYPGWVAASALTFLNQREAYRFQVSEKTQKLLVGPGRTYLVGPGHWWKRRSEDMKDNDNTFFTGRSPEFTAVENIEGADTGNRVDFEGVFVYSVENGAIYNNLGDKVAAHSIVERGIISDFRMFCREASRSPEMDPMKTDDILRKENNIRLLFGEFFKGMAKRYLDAWGVALDIESSRLENIDYDAATKEVRRKAGEAVRKAAAERERQDIITGGIKDPRLVRLALAADGESQDVKVTANEIDLHVTGDEGAIAGLSHLASNPAALDAARNIAGKGNK